jgi:arsenate reductase
MKPIIAFICLGNSCRSIMAEAISRHYYGSEVEALSAGLRPLGWVAPETLTVLEELGIPTTGLRSKGLNEINLADCRAVINLTAGKMSFPLPPGFKGRIYQHPVMDPYGFILGTYRHTRDTIIELIKEKISLWVVFK